MALESSISLNLPKDRTYAIINASLSLNPFHSSERTAFQQSSFLGHIRTGERWVPLPFARQGLYTLIHTVSRAWFSQLAVPPLPLAGSLLTSELSMVPTNAGPDPTHLKGDKTPSRARSPSLLPVLPAKPFLQPGLSFGTLRQAGVRPGFWSERPVVPKGTGTCPNNWVNKDCKVTKPLLSQQPVLPPSGEFWVSNSWEAGMSPGLSWVGGKGTVVPTSTATCPYGAWGKGCFLKDPPPPSQPLVSVPNCINQ